MIEGFNRDDFKSWVKAQITYNIEYSTNIGTRCSSNLMSNADYVYDNLSAEEWVCYLGEYLAYKRKH